ncbi:MAG: hypothetical protein H6734_15085 [Alphaproteobacteria bacterium]|nr:hypothetical protein [Alphaproteobacteria bacterium]
MWSETRWAADASCLDSDFYAVSVLGGMVAGEATFEVVFDEVAEDGWALAARAEAIFVIG